MTETENKEVYVFCNVCRKNILLNIPETSLDNRKGGLLSILSVHGTPTHAVLFYLDKDFRVRGAEESSILTDDDLQPISYVGEESIETGSQKGIQIENVIQAFGQKEKTAISNLSYVIVQMMLGNNVYLVESNIHPADEISKFIFEFSW